VTTVIEAYRELVTTTESAYPELHAEFGDDARSLVELMMLLDTVFFDTGTSHVALMTPLHPLLLWHYAEYARVIRDQKDLLDARDTQLIRSEFKSGGVPFFFASLGIPRTVSSAACRSSALTATRVIRMTARGRSGG
jgi:hypothetical protein